MHGWSLFKQGQARGGAAVVLRRARPQGRRPATGEAELDSLDGLTPRRPRAGRGHLPRHQPEPGQPAGRGVDPALHRQPDARKRYEFRVYQQLGELYIKQDRVKDAADTFGAFATPPAAACAGAAAAGARDRDLPAGRLRHAGARGEEGLRLALRHRQRVPQGQPRGLGAAQPLVKTHLAELARHYHATAQKSKRQRRLPGGGALVPRLHRARSPTIPTPRRTTSCWPSCCSRTSSFARCRGRVREDAPTATRAHAEERRRGLRRAAELRGAGEGAPRPPSCRRCSATGVDSALRFAKAFPTDPRAGTVLTNAAEKLFALRDGERAADGRAAGAGARAAGRRRRSAAWPGP